MWSTHRTEESPIQVWAPEFSYILWCLGFVFHFLWLGCYWSFAKLYFHIPSMNWAHPWGKTLWKKKKKGKLALLKFQFRLHSQIYLCFSFILQQLQVFIYAVFRCFGCNKYREWATRKNQVLWTCFSCIGPSFYINHGILGMGTTFSSSMVLSHLKKSLEWSDMLKFSLIFYL